MKNRSAIGCQKKVNARNCDAILKKLPPVIITQYSHLNGTWLCTVLFNSFLFFNFTAYVMLDLKQVSL